MKYKLIILSVVITFLISLNVFASGFDLETVIRDARIFEKAAIEYSSNVQTLTVVSQLALGGIAIGTIVAVAGGIVIGIRLMTASASEKADIKLSLTGYVIGICILFGAFGIWAAAVNILQGIDKLDDLPAPPAFVERQDTFKKFSNVFNNGTTTGFIPSVFNAISTGINNAVTGAQNAYLMPRVNALPPSGNAAVDNIIKWAKSRVGGIYAQVTQAFNDSSTEKYVVNPNYPTYDRMTGKQYDTTINIDSATLGKCAFDCSSFVYRAHASAGTVPVSNWTPTAGTLKNTYTKVSGISNVNAKNLSSTQLASMKPGDLVHTDGHVMLYVGDGLVIHASGVKGGVKISDLKNYNSTILAVVRIVNW